MIENYFSIERDKFFSCFCQACVVGKTGEEMSKKDTRYCLECQPIIEAEYAIARKKYVPFEEPKIEALNNSDNQVGIESQKTKMSTLTEEPSTVDKFKVSGRPNTYKKRPLPDNKIKQLHEEGMGYKAIATKLKNEQGITVSYQTIERVLSGQRS